MTELEFNFLAWAGLPGMKRGKYLFSTHLLGVSKVTECKAQIAA